MRFVALWAETEISDCWCAFSAPHPVQATGVSCSAAPGALFMQSGTDFIGLTKWEPT